MKIKYLIDTILSPKLTALSFVDRYASIVRTINIAETESGIIKRYPVSCDVSAVDCVNTGLYQDLVPDDSKSSVVYWEMIQPMSNVGFTKTRDFYQKRFRGTARLVVWLNLAKLGIDNCTSSLELIPIIEKELTTKGKIIGGIYDGNLLWIQPRNMVKQDINVVFGNYDYTKLKNYYLYPFDFFAIDVEFTMEQCLSKGGIFPTLPALDCENEIIDTPVLCKSMDLDGVNEYFAYGVYPNPFTGNDAFNFEYTDSFTLSLWVKFDTVGIGHPLINKYNSSISKGYFFLINNLNQIRFGMQSQGGQIFEIRTTDTITSGIFYNIVATYDGSNTIGGLNIYINDNLANFNPIFNLPLISTLIDANQPLEIGRLGTGFGYLNGLISRIRIWNTELSAVEVTTEYNTGIINPIPVQSGNLVLDADIPNAEFLTADPTYGTGYLINNKIDNNKLFTYNSEEEDLIDECPE